MSDLNGIHDHKWYLSERDRLFHCSDCTAIATVEQIAQHIAEIESSWYVTGEWAKLWKRAAKHYRRKYLHWHWQWQQKVKDALSWLIERDEARAWAALWKRAAKEHRKSIKYWEGCFFDLNEMLDTAKREHEGARADAVKVAKEYRRKAESQDALLDLGHLVLLECMKGVREARAWAISYKRAYWDMRRKWGKLQDELDSAKWAPNWALTKIKELQAELDKVRLKHDIADASMRACAVTCEVGALWDERDKLQATIEEMAVNASVKQRVYQSYRRDADRGRERIRELEAEVESLKAELSDEGADEPWGIEIEVDPDYVPMPPRGVLVATLSIEEAKDE